MESRGRAPDRDDWHAQTTDTVLRSFNASIENGLSSACAHSLIKTHGENRLQESAPDPIWLRFAGQFRELVIWILIAAAIIAGLLGEWIDAIVILIIVVLNAILSFVQEERASQALAALRQVVVPATRVRRDGELVSLPASELVPGDIMLLEAGDMIPADARLLECSSFSTEEASLTGESAAIEKTAASELPPEAPLGDRINCVFMGTKAVKGNAIALVTATGMQTQLGQIAGMLVRERRQLTPLQIKLAELGRSLVFVCLALVTCVFLAQLARGSELVETLLVAVSLGVAAVPEGLPAVVTIALAIGLTRMARRNALIRKLPSVETLGSVTVICSDKTGTLTRNEMTVREIYAGDHFYRLMDKRFVEQPSTSDTNHLQSHSDRRAALDLLLRIAANCNNAEIQFGEHGKIAQIVGEPTESALLVAAAHEHIHVKLRDRKIVDEIPFDSDRKMMSIMLADEDRHRIFCKGAAEVILDRCTRVLQHGKTVELSAKIVEKLQHHIAAMADRALRVMAFAYRDLTPATEIKLEERDLIFVGLCGMIDPPRDEAKTAVANCHRAGIRPVMITGDHPATAMAIGRELGIADSEALVVTGPEIDNISDAELKSKVADISIYARVTAEHKLRVVKAWQSHGELVAMTGDGVNDAPAIQAANIGIAMGITGTEVTKEAADMVLTDDNFASIVNAVREGRGIYDNIQKFVHYLLSCNAGEVLLMFAASIMGLPLPLVALQILWINLVTDGLPALALAVEAPEPDLMDRKPTPPGEPVLNWTRGSRILLHGVLMAATAFIAFIAVLESAATDLPHARSIAFGIVAFSQLAFAFACRSQTFPLLRLGLHSNKWLVLAVVISALLQVAIMTWGPLQTVFGVVPLSWGQWILVFFCSLIPMALVELIKISTIWCGRPQLEIGKQRGKI